MMALVKGAAWMLGLMAVGDALAATSQPIELWSNVSKFAPVNPDRILFQQDGALVLKTSQATKEDFADLYVVNTNNWFTMPETMRDYGEVLAFEPTKFAVMRVTEDKVAALFHMLHHAGTACGPLLKLNGNPVESRLAATPTPVIPVTTRDERVTNAVAQVSADNIKAVVEAIAALPTRYHRSSSGTGSSVADLLAEKYEALRVGRNDVTINVFDHGSDTPQNSLVVRIEGRTRPTEVIVLGSHLDSINGSNPTNGRSPGADDNASGTATNLEIFRVMMEQGVALDRTLEIHAYAAEEIGLVGSQDIASKYKADSVNVVAMVQHDMNIWKAAGTEDKIWFVSNNTNTAFNTLLSTLVDGYVGMAWGTAALSGGSSDHASWNREGFAAAFPFENPRGYNRSIHTANDTTANASAFTQAAGFAKLGLAYVMHFGGVN